MTTYFIGEFHQLSENQPSVWLYLTGLIWNLHSLDSLFFVCLWIYCTLFQVQVCTKSSLLFYFSHVTYRVFGKVTLLIHPLSRKVWRCALNFDTFSTYAFKLVNHPHPTRYVLFNRFDVFVAPSLAWDKQSSWLGATDMLWIAFCFVGQGVPVISAALNRGRHVSLIHKALAEEPFSQYCFKRALFMLEGYLEANISWSPEFSLFLCEWDFAGSKENYMDHFQF